MSPDLEVRITSQALDQAAAQRIAHSEWPPDALLVKAGGDSSRLLKWLTSKKDQGELFIGAHDILHDKADWTSETWLFAPSAIPRFIATLERLYELLPEQFELVAAWGDKPLREQPHEDSAGNDLVEQCIGERGAVSGERWLGRDSIMPTLLLSTTAVRVTESRRVGVEPLESLWGPDAASGLAGKRETTLWKPQRFLRKS